MNEAELAEILKCLNGALKVFASRQHALKASEISLKSLLTVLQSQVASQLHAVKVESHFTNDNASSFWREIATNSKPPLPLSPYNTAESD